MRFGKILSEIYKSVSERYTELTDMLFNAFLDAAIVLDEASNSVPAYMAYALDDDYSDPVKVVKTALKHYKIPEDVSEEVLNKFKELMSYG